MKTLWTTLVTTANRLLDWIRQPRRRRPLAVASLRDELLALGDGLMRQLDSMIGRADLLDRRRLLLLRANLRVKRARLRGLQAARPSC